jgi:hypothetical protein
MRNELGFAPFVMLSAVEASVYPGLSTSMFNVERFMSDVPNGAGSEPFAGLACRGPLALTSLIP